MKHIVTTNKSIEQAAADLEAAIVGNQFGLLHVHDLKATMNNKGVDFPNECKVFEVCNPHKANAVLTRDISLNMALPCRISIWEEGGELKIGTLEPTKLLGILSDDPELAKVAVEVEVAIKKIIEEAR